MRRVVGSLVLGALVIACGGGGETQKPVEALPPPTVAPPPAPVPDVPPAATTDATSAKPSVQDTAKAVLGAVTDAVGAHDPAKFTANYTDDAVLVTAGAPEPFKGKDALAADVKRLFDAFPNGKLAFARAWAKADVLVAEWVMTGTHTGELSGMKGTDKPVGYTGLSVVWLTADGKIKEEHRYFDTGTILSQIGASKGKGRPVATLPASTEWHVAKSDAVEDKDADAAKAMYATFEKKDDKGFADANTDDVVWDDMVAPGPTKGKAENVKQFKTFLTAFPDIKLTPTNVWGVEDFAITEVTMTGSPKGNFMGMVSQTKKPVTLHMVDVVQLKDGKAIKGWSYGNSVELLSQFGLMKPTAPTGGKPAAPKADAKPAAPKADAKPAPKK